MNKVVKVNTAELIAVFEALTSHKFVSVEYQTETKLRKNPFFDKVNKLVKVVILCGTEYQKAVNNKLKKTGIETPDFVKTETYVERSEKYSAITQKIGDSQKYLSYFEQRRDFEAFFDFQGNEISKDLINEFLPKFAPKKQIDSGLDETNFVVRKNLKLENIIQIVVDGTTYIHKP